MAPRSGKALDKAVQGRFAELSAERPEDAASAKRRLLQLAPAPPSHRPISAGVPLVRSSGERAISGINAQAVDIFRGQLASVQPFCPPNYLPYLQSTAYTDPIFSRWVKLMEGMANSGHQVVFDVEEGREADSARAEAELAGLNERLSFMGGGIDGLINSLVAQVAVTGAISCEAILAANRRSVSGLELVPSQDIQFKRGDDGAWLAQQRVGRGLRDLDPRTYDYIPWRTVDNNPWAIPPALAAINCLLRQSDMDDQVDALYRKAGWLGSAVLTVPKQEQPIDSELDPDEWAREKESQLAQMLLPFAANMRRGIVAVEEGTKFEFQASAGQAIAGASEAVWMNQELICMALGVDPSQLGFNRAKTETWLGVAWMGAGVTATAAQRLVRSRLEAVLRLHFALVGISVGARVVFDPLGSVRPNEDATAFATKWGAIKNMVINGALDPDAGMKEMGYEGWHDKARLPNNEGFDSQSNWSFIKEAVREGLLTPEEGAKALGFEGWADESKIRASTPDLMGGGIGFMRHAFRFNRNDATYTKSLAPVVDDVQERRREMGQCVVLAFRKLAKRGKSVAPKYIAGPGQEALARMVDRFLARYAGKVAPVLGRLQFDILEDLGAALKAETTAPWKDDAERNLWVGDVMQRSFAKHWADYGNDEFHSSVLDTHEEMAAAWRTKDRSAWASGQIPPEAKDATGAAQTAATEALAQNDTFHMSVYLEGMSGDERKAFESMISTEFLAAGQDITNPDVVDDLLNRMERNGGLLLRRRDHGREGGQASETDEEARDRMAGRIQRIVSTSVMRSRNTSAVYAMRDADISTFRIVASVNPCARICAPMDGRTFEVEAVAKALEDFHAQSPEAQEQQLTDHRDLTEEERASIPFAQLPPFHPNCACNCESED